MYPLVPTACTPNPKEEGHTVWVKGFRVSSGQESEKDMGTALELVQCRNLSDYNESPF